MNIRLSRAEQIKIANLYQDILEENDSGVLGQPEVAPDINQLENEDDYNQDDQRKAFLLGNIQTRSGRIGKRRRKNKK
jgi:hypothetical protein